LKRALRHIQDELDSLPDDDHETLSATDREDLRRQSDDAQKHLQDAVRKMRQDMRDILREAKERGKAEKLDAKDWKSF
jgi:DNA-directed RNA polymerase subunit L